MPEHLYVNQLPILTPNDREVKALVAIVDNGKSRGEFKRVPIDEYTCQTREEAEQIIDAAFLIGKKPIIILI